MFNIFSKKNKVKTEQMDNIEKLARLTDEEEWNKIFMGKLIRAYSKQFLTYLLLIISFAFMILSGLHGYVGSLNQGVLTSMMLAITYGAVEPLVITSSILTGWSGLPGKGNFIRIIGYVIFTVSMIFSIFILMNNFSTSSEISERSSNRITTIEGSITRNIKQLEDKKEKLLALDLPSLGVAKSNVLTIKQEKTCGRKKNLLCWKSTDKCNPSQTTAKSSRNFCSRFSKLDGILSDVITLEGIDDKLAILEEKLGNTGTITSSGSQNELIHKISGIDKDMIQLAKPSLEAAVVAFVTHLGWLILALVIGGSLESDKNTFFTKRILQRKVRKEEDLISYEKNAAQSEHDKIQKAIDDDRQIKQMAVNLPIQEKPSTLQITEFIGTNMIKVEGESTNFSEFSDKFNSWLSFNNASLLPIDRISELLRDAGHVPFQGQILGLVFKI